MTLPHPNMTLPPFLWQGHFFRWQIHYFGVLGHFLSHDRFRAKVWTKVKNIIFFLPFFMFKFFMFILYDFPCIRVLVLVVPLLLVSLLPLMFLTLSLSMPLYLSLFFPSLILLPCLILSCFPSCSCYSCPQSCVDIYSFAGGVGNYGSEWKSLPNINFETLCTPAEALLHFFKRGRVWSWSCLPFYSCSL